MEILDLRPVAEHLGRLADVSLSSDEDLLTETLGSGPLNNKEIHVMNQSIRLT